MTRVWKLRIRKRQFTPFNTNFSVVSIFLMNAILLEGDRITARIKPFRVIEDTRVSRVYGFAEGTPLIAEIPHDHLWQQALGELFEECRLIA